MQLGSVRTQPAGASLAEPHRERITRWWRQAVQGTTIQGALVRSHGFTGSYSSVRLFLAGVEAGHPQVATVLEFDPGEVEQADFGKGPEVLEPHTGELLSTWVFVMTLTWLCHAYADVVTDQKVATWLGCHRRAATPDHRQPQVRDHPALLPRFRGAACLRGVRRGLRIQDRALPAARPEEEVSRFILRSFCYVRSGFSIPSGFPAVFLRRVGAERSVEVVGLVVMGRRLQPSLEAPCFDGVDSHTELRGDLDAGQVAGLAQPLSDSSAHRRGGSAGPSTDAERGPRRSACRAR